MIDRVTAPARRADDPEIIDRAIRALAAVVVGVVVENSGARPSMLAVTASTWLWRADQDSDHTSLVGELFGRAIGEHPVEQALDAADPVGVALGDLRASAIASS